MRGSAAAAAKVSPSPVPAAAKPIGKRLRTESSEAGPRPVAIARATTEEEAVTRRAAEDGLSANVDETGAGASAPAATEPEAPSAVVANRKVREGHSSGTLAAVQVPGKDMAVDDVFLSENRAPESCSEDSAGNDELVRTGVGQAAEGAASSASPVPESVSNGGGDGNRDGSDGDGGGGAAGEVEWAENYDTKPSPKNTSGSRRCGNNTAGTAAVAPVASIPSASRSCGDANLVDDDAGNGSHDSGGGGGNRGRDHSAVDAESGLASGSSSADPSGMRGGSADMVAGLSSPVLLAGVAATGLTTGGTQQD